MVETETSFESLATDTDRSQEHHKEPGSEGSKEKENEEKKDDKPRTRIGRKEGKGTDDKLIDEAEWETKEPEKGPEKDFAITILKSGDKFQLKILSPFLQKAFRAAVEYYPQVIVEGESVAFNEPYAPLYFYNDEIRRKCEAWLGPEKEEDK